MTRVVRQRGRVDELHGLVPFGDGDPEPQVWWHDPTDAAVVLGSRQRPEMLDLDVCARAGLAVVRRRSGGGAVIVRPGSMCWIDLVVPHGVAPDDVRGSMVWAGECWLTALDPTLDGTDVSLHRGGLVSTPWSDLVCFAGHGPGEVLAGDHKLVGLSQRRTRDGLRVQGLVHTAPTDDLAARLWRVAHPDVELPMPAVLRSLAGADRTEALAGRLAAAVERHRHIG